MFETIWGKKTEKKNELKAEKKSEQSFIIAGMTLDQVRVAMLQLVIEQTGNHYRMGLLYNYVVDGGLAEKEGYKNAQDYFGQKIRELSPAALSMYGAVARNFSAAVCTQFGVTCLYLLLVYQEATAIALNHDAPGGTLIEVPESKGELKPKPFFSCSVRDMRNAIQRKRKPASSQPLPDSDRTLAAQYMKVVEGRFSKGDAVRVQLRNHKGKAVIDFKGIPLEKVSKLAEALMAQLHAVPEEGSEEKAPQ